MSDSGSSLSRLQLISIPRPANLEFDFPIQLQLGKSGSSLRLFDGDVNRTFRKFNGVYDSQTTEEAFIYDNTDDILTKFLNRGHVAILSYGDADVESTFRISGRTTTSTSHSVGLFRMSIRRFALFLFEELRGLTGNVVTQCFLESVEIEREQFHDLLDPDRKNIHIRGNRSEGFFLSGVRTLALNSIRDVFQYLDSASSQRTIVGSRPLGHWVVTISMVIRNVESGDTAISRATFINLVSNENISEEPNSLVSRSLSSARRSLQALSQLTQAIHHQASHIPFRTSKLTTLLFQPLLTLNSVLLFVSCSSDSSDIDKTISALKFCESLKPRPRARSSNKARNRIGKKIRVNIRTRRNLAAPLLVCSSADEDRAVTEESEEVEEEGEGEQDVASLRRMIVKIRREKEWMRLDFVQQIEELERKLRESESERTRLRNELESLNERLIEDNEREL